MNNNLIFHQLQSLLHYVEEERFQGYDPYDTLNSRLPFKQLGRIGASVAIQIQKRNPVNIRPVLGIKKGYNPKGMGLFLKAYCKLFLYTRKSEYLERAKWLFEWLCENYSTGFSGICWGYNFDWASPGSYLPAYTPSVVVTSFVCDGIFEYYKITGNPTARTALLSAADYINNDIPLTELNDGISFSYTHLMKDCCYNASLLASEILAKADFVNNTSIWRQKVEWAINFVLSRQKEDGVWYYSYDPETGVERKQVDFHQGFIIVSLHNLTNLYDLGNHIIQALKKGTDYYYRFQFMRNGRSLWRLPEKWPTDIHHQSQGIITFSRLKEFNNGYLPFANMIAEWTIRKMQSYQGFFYYRKNQVGVNKIPYMRWSQGWMALALAELLNNNEA